MSTHDESAIGGSGKGSPTHVKQLIGLTLISLCIPWPEARSITTGKLLFRSWRDTKTIAARHQLAAEVRSASSLGPQSKTVATDGLASKLLYNRSRWRLRCLKLGVTPCLFWSARKGPNANCYWIKTPTKKKSKFLGVRSFSLSDLYLPTSIHIWWLLTAHSLLRSTRNPVSCQDGQASFPLCALYLPFILFLFPSVTFSLFTPSPASSSLHPSQRLVSNGGTSCELPCPIEHKHVGCIPQPSDSHMSAAPTGWSSMCVPWSVARPFYCQQKMFNEFHSSPRR